MKVNGIENMAADTKINSVIMELYVNNSHRGSTGPAFSTVGELREGAKRTAEDWKGEDIRVTYSFWVNEDSRNPYTHFASFRVAA